MKDEKHDMLKSLFNITWYSELALAQ